MNKYKKEIEKRLENGDLDKGDLNVILEHIRFFQHERLIHLLVTIFFGLLSVFGFLSMIIYPNWMTILFTALVLIPEIFYILHYYKLENGVQEMYSVYDRVREK